MNDTNSIAWLGLDAHSKNCVLGQLDDHGTEVKGWGFPTKPEQLIKHVQAIPATDKRLMLEESTLALWIGQLLKPHVQQLVVCGARRNQVKPARRPPPPQRDLFTRLAKSYERPGLGHPRLKLQLKALFHHWGLF